MSTAWTEIDPPLVPCTTTPRESEVGGSPAPADRRPLGGWRHTLCALLLYVGVPVLWLGFIAAVVAAQIT